MNKFLLGLALVAPCSSPALAGNVRARQAHTVDGYALPYWVYPLPHSERLANSLGGWTVAIPPILIGSLASLIRGTGALELAAATARSLRGLAQAAV